MGRRRASLRGLPGASLTSSFKRAGCAATAATATGHGSPNRQSRIESSMKSKKIVFTICARNYYGLAQVLKRSVLQQNPDVEFFAFIADGLPAHERAEFGDDAIDASAIMASYVTSEKLREMAFKYNLTEFCTALKPFCFRHLFDQTDCEAAMYLDPDVFVYSTLDDVFAPLATASIVLTPHLVYPSLAEGKRPDKGMLATGVFNLGFLALARSATSDAFLGWWGQRLLDQCFMDNHDALFTDQKWIDFVPTLFPAADICCFRHAGTNLAPWNFHERVVLPDADGALCVSRRRGEAPGADIEAPPYSQDEKLIFVHFSGFDYKKLCEGQVVQYNIDGLNLYPDLDPVIERYVQGVKDMAATVLRFMGKPYLYANYDNGRPILSFHRRLYRGTLEVDLPLGNPFSTAPQSLFSRLQKSALLGGNTGGASVDKSNKNNLDGIGRKLALFNRLMRGLKAVIGFDNYLLLLRLMRPYSRPESQLHLIDQRFDRLL
jgi:hypothetical protein